MVLWYNTIRKGGGDMKVSEDTYMTDEQFATYNKLLELVETVIKELPEEKQEEYRQKKNDILLKK